MSWTERPMAAFDLETTGVDVTRDRIVTACVATIDGADVDPWTWLLNPGVEIPDEAAAVHGISTERAQAEGLNYGDGYAQIRASVDNAWADGRAVVAFNASFDLSLLDAEGARLGWPPLQPGLVIDPFVIDRAMDPYRRGSRNLSATCAHYGVELGKAHDATSDALAAARLAWRLARRFPRLAELGSDEVMEEQAGWHRERQADFAAYLVRSGKSPDGVSGDWPLRNRIGAAA